jgi:transcriptional regulator with XRE-family HTH domain
LINLKSYDMKKLTGTQVRAARALIRWSAEDLANAAGVGIATIRRAEAEDEFPSTTPANLNAIRTALEGAGVEFIREDDGKGVGVRLAKASEI